MTKKTATDGRGMLACASSLCTKNVPGRTATDTCNRKPVNSAISLHVAECRECGQSARFCRILELLRGGKQIVSLSVSRTQPSTSKRVLHPKILCASNRGGSCGPRGPSNRTLYDAGLYGTSQPAPVLKASHLDRNTFVEYKKRTKKGSPALPPIPGTRLLSGGICIVSRSAPVLKDTHLDQNTIVSVKPHKERVTGVTAGTRKHAFAV